MNYKNMRYETIEKTIVLNGLKHSLKILADRLSNGWRVWGFAIIGEQYNGLFWYGECTDYEDMKIKEVVLKLVEKMKAEVENDKKEKEEMEEFNNWDGFINF
ncbi:MULTISPECIES: hypothetical protein [unclassified Bacillus (in: firmicutes)]|uniref:hypothetical protein n=1 Tax=unclassified Bacillus (in: firmicutes) TaxID=185979 RepID=UPI000D025C39|nr:hypothetical protein [Bacillus sp. MZGC1]PRS47576.1 hypothetical protein C6Y06_18690 [Bacillus sp. MZGC1]